MLIRVPEHNADDLERWTLAERVDEIRCRLWGPRLERMRLRALEDMAEFAAGGPCFAGTSWGKDSTVLAHLVAELCRERGVVIPLVWVRVEPFANPHCHAVRDAFLAQHGRVVNYSEAVARSDVRLDDLPDSERERIIDDVYNEATEAHLGGRWFGLRRVSGIRAEESAVRRFRVGRWGSNSPNASAPIGRWRVDHVFAYLHQHRLPVHPSYAMTGNGRWSREWLRVAALGGGNGSERGRREWEQLYYGRHLAGMRNAKRGQPAEPAQVDENHTPPNDRHHRIRVV